MDKIFSDYLAYFESLTPDTVTNLSSLVTSDFLFVDPFNEIRGPNCAIKLFNHMFEAVSDPRFVITDVVGTKDHIYARWDFHFRSQLLRGGPQHRIDGVSLIYSNGGGLICEHRDFWDSNSQLFVNLRLLGGLFRLARKIGGN